VRESPAADEDEIVGGEEVAEVPVGQRAMVRGIAAALEPVELERLERIDRRDLVVHEDAAPGLRHAGQLGERQLGPAHVVKRAP